MKSFITFLSAIILSTSAWSQKNVTLTIAHKLGAENFHFDQTARNNMDQEFRITRIDYYISGIEIIHDGGMVTPVEGKYILVKGDANVSEPLGSFDLTEVEGITFSIGVDTPLNHADPSVQEEHSPLSFQTPSMHWGWSTGYRFVALEGKTGAGFTTDFQLHGMWDANYLEQTVMAAGVNSGSEVTINLDADYTEAIRDINVASGPIEHGTNGADRVMIYNFKDNVFKPGSGLPSSLKNIYENKSIALFPNPASGSFTVAATDPGLNISSYKLTDISGRVIQEDKFPASGIISLNAGYSGLLIISLYNQEEMVAIKKVTLR